MSYIALPTPIDLWTVEGGLNRERFSSARIAQEYPYGSFAYSQLTCTALALMCCELIKKHPEWYRAYTAMVIIPARKQSEVMAMNLTNEYWYPSDSSWSFGNPSMFPLHVQGMHRNATTYLEIIVCLERLLEKLLALGDPE